MFQCVPFFYPIDFNCKTSSSSKCVCECVCVPDKKEERFHFWMYCPFKTKGVSAEDVNGVLQGLIYIHKERFQGHNRFLGLPRSALIIVEEESTEDVDFRNKNIKN